MKILIVTPAPAESQVGNRVTAARWARMLRGLGHRVLVERRFRGQTCDALLALHARRSAGSIEAFARQWPDRPLLVALTGTDLYRDLPGDAQAQRSLELAWRLIVLQPQAVDDLPAPARSKARVIYQSAEAPAKAGRPRQDVFEVCVLGHLRPVKDPFRAALAARRLPAESKVRVVQLGGALSAAMERRARREEKVNPRYRWLGEWPQGRALRRMAACRLLVNSSRMEGGANVVSEAIVAGVPVLASRIAGSIGMLGAEYPGYFEYGDTRGLTDLLRRAEQDRPFYRDLQRWCRRLRPRFAPQRERAALRALMAEVSAEAGLVRKDRGGRSPAR